MFLFQDSFSFSPKRNLQIDATFFQFVLQKVKIKMADFHHSTKLSMYDTKFSQKSEHSLERTTQKEQGLQHKQLNNALKEGLIIKKPSNSTFQEDESFLYIKQQFKQNNTENKECSQKINGKEDKQFRLSQSFAQKRRDFNQNIKTYDSLTCLESQIKVKSEGHFLNGIQSDSNYQQTRQQDEIFSEKLSMIQSLQSKLLSLQEKIKTSSIPLNKCNASSFKKNKNHNNNKTHNNNKNNNKINNFQKYPSNLSQKLKQHSQRFSINSEFGIKNSQVNKKNNIFNPSVNLEKNQSLYSESMLLDRDFTMSKKSFSQLNLLNPRIQQNKEKVIQQHKDKAIQQNKHKAFQQNKVQIVEIIKVVEVPYLIEVFRDVQQKIQPKKSFYFEQNEQIHQTFEQFTKKESENNEMLKLQTNVHYENILENQLDYSRTNIIKNSQGQNAQNSIISLNETNRTFHQQLREKCNDASYNFGENSQILSKLLTKNVSNQLQEFEQKMKSYQIENEQLQIKLYEKQETNKQLRKQNQLLTQQLSKLVELQFFCLENLKKYEENISKSKQKLEQMQNQQVLKTKQHYQKVIEQYKNQQAQYANRIISFQQLFQQNLNKQKYLTQFIERQQQKIKELQIIALEKDSQIQSYALKIIQIENFVMKREQELKIVIQNLQKDNQNLKNYIEEINKRQKSQGFYLLNQQAQQLKKTLQQKDSAHSLQLENLQNRYTNIITKYQSQLETMKKRLQKVKFDKSVSLQKTQNSQKQSQSMGKKGNKVQKEINSLAKNQPGHSSAVKQQQNTLMKITDNGEQKREINESTENSNEEIINQQHQIQNNSMQNKYTLQLFENPQNFHQFQDFTINQISYLKEENSKLQRSLQKQRQEKQKLSIKLKQFTDILSQNIQKLNESQTQLQKNDQVLQKCVIELQKQYQINMKLKLQLQKTKELIKNQSQLQNKINEIIDEQKIKLHPTFLQLNKKYIKSKKYIKALQKQILQLSSLGGIGQQIKSCCINKDSVIKQLKQIAFGSVITNQLPN